MKTILDTGCHIVAQAAKSAKVDFVSAYPITPQTSVVEEIASMVQRGEIDCRFLPVEGEHSAMAACVAAAATGARTFTATSSQGLLYMHEVLHMASGCRFPIVMANVNRGVFAPWTIWVDHQDSLSQRDTGWLQYYCASLQEVFDTIIQAYKVAEQIKIPIMVNLDGFVLSHCVMAVQIPDQEIIDRFLPTVEPAWRFDPQNPTSYVSVTGPDLYEGFRTSLHQDQLKALDLMVQAAREYQELTGLYHGDLLDLYRCDDANTFVFAMGSMAEELKLSVDILREEGIKIGLIRLRVFRPFPKEAISKVLPEDATVVVLDRNFAFGHEGGILFSELKDALFTRRDNVRLLNQIMGIGGIDLTYQYMAEQVKNLLGL